MKTLRAAIGYTDSNEPVSLASDVEVGPLLFGIEVKEGTTWLRVQHPEFGRLRFPRFDLTESHVNIQDAKT